jgi:2-dehydropantoate 2-reductase
LLAREGYDVFALARGTHLEAVRTRGLEIQTVDGSWNAPVTVSDDASVLARSFDARDFAIIAVKAYSLGEVAPAINAFAERGVTLLPLLNGVDVVDRLAALGVARELILGGLTYVSAARIAPGVIERRSSFQRIQVGEFSRERSARAQRIAATFAGAGAEATVADDIEVALWQKFVFLSSISAACGLMRAPVGAVMESERGRSLVEGALREVLAVAEAKGVRFPGDEYQRAMGLLQSLPREMRPSFLLDVEAGTRTEVDALSGTIARLGDASGVATPVHDSVVAGVS